MANSDFGRIGNNGDSKMTPEQRKAYFFSVHVNNYNRLHNKKDQPSSFLPTGKKPDIFWHGVYLSSLKDDKERKIAHDKFEKQYYPTEWKESQIEQRKEIQRKQREDKSKEMALKRYSDHLSVLNQKNHKRK